MTTIFIADTMLTAALSFAIYYCMFDIALRRYLFKRPKAQKVRVSK